MNFIMMILFFLSGALFPIEDLSNVLSTIIKFNPLSYGVDAIRQTLTGTGSFNLLFDFCVLFFLTIIIIILGTKMFESLEA
jgi:ABC-2 type transport system permease protein